MREQIAKLVLHSSFHWNPVVQGSLPVAYPVRCTLLFIETDKRVYAFLMRFKDELHSSFHWNIGYGGWWWILDEKLGCTLLFIETKEGMDYWFSDRRECCTLLFIETERLAEGEKHVPDELHSSFHWNKALHEMIQQYLHGCTLLFIETGSPETGFSGRPQAVALFFSLKRTPSRWSHGWASIMLHSSFHWNEAWSEASGVGFEHKLHSSFHWNEQNVDITSAIYNHYVALFFSLKPTSFC